MYPLILIYQIIVIMELASRCPKPIGDIELVKLHSLIPDGNGLGFRKRAVKRNPSAPFDKTSGYHQTDLPCTSGNGDLFSFEIHQSLRFGRPIYRPLAWCTDCLSLDAPLSGKTWSDSRR